MMMVFKDITTLSGYGVELMITQIREYSPRDTKGIIELIVRIIHLIYTKDGFQATLIKGPVVSDQRQPLYQRLYLCPNLWEHGCIVRVFMAESVHLTAPIIIIVRLGLDERIERIHYLAITNNDDTNRTDAAPLVVCRFKIYGCKVSHHFCFRLQIYE